MKHASGWRLRAGVALMALLCASGAVGQNYEPDEDDDAPPEAIPHAHLYRPPIHDPGDEPPMDPDPDRFPRRHGARMMGGPDIDRLPPPPPPPPIDRRGPRLLPMEPDFDRPPPRERIGARPLTQRPPEEPPRVRPRAIVPPPDAREAQSRSDQSRAARARATALENRSKAPPKPVADRNDGPPPRVAPPAPVPRATAAQTPPRAPAPAQTPTLAPAPAPAPVAAQMTRAESLAKPRSDLDNVAGFVNRGEGKINLEK